MNGNWNRYGMQPLRYIQRFQELYTVIKAIVPTVAIVWAPNTGQGCVKCRLAGMYQHVDFAGWLTSLALPRPQIPLLDAVPG